MHGAFGGFEKEVGKGIAWHRHVCIDFMPIEGVVHIVL
jgi:hypothetical protein